MRSSNDIAAAFLLLAGMAASAVHAQPAADETDAGPPTATGETPWSSAILGQSAVPGTASTICQFMSGPKAHGWHDYAPLAPAALGSACRDGAGSAGIVVAKGHGQQY